MDCVWPYLLWVIRRQKRDWRAPVTSSRRILLHAELWLRRIARLNGWSQVANVTLLAQGLCLQRLLLPDDLRGIAETALLGARPCLRRTVPRGG